MLFGKFAVTAWTFDVCPNSLLNSCVHNVQVLELLSSSPRAIDIYSHCAMSSVVEFAPTNMDEYILPTSGYPPKMFVRRGDKGHAAEAPRSLNDYISAEEKLEIALEMAKAIAVMHGFKDGVIANADVQIGQFFRGSDGVIKIVDYNRAEPLLYDRKDGRYCPWTNGYPGEGTLRAPEENIDAPLTEQVDVFSLGNVFFALLTGTHVWHGHRDFDKRIHRIVEGEQRKIPDFYYKEPSSRLLAEAITMCWTYYAEERPSIFDLVQLLEQAVAEHPVIEDSWG